MGKLRKNKFLLSLMFPGILYLVVVILFPMISTLILSFQKYDFVKPASETQWVGFSNYIELMKDSLFWISLKNTLVYIFFAVSIEFVLGLIIALLIYKILSEKSIIISLVLLPSIMAPVIVGLIFRYMFNTEFGILSYLLNKIGLFNDISILGSMNTALGAIILADVWQWTPFIAIMLLAGLVALPVEPYEAARIDGANEFEVLKNITLPLLVPIIRIALMLRIVDVIKEFDKIFVMTEGGPGTASETMNFLAYRINFRFFDMGMGSSAVVIILIIIIFISIILFKMLKTEELY